MISAVFVDLESQVVTILDQLILLGNDCQMLFDKRWTFRRIFSVFIFPYEPCPRCRWCCCTTIIVLSLMWVATKLCWECFMLTYPYSFKAGPQSTRKGICLTVEAAYHVYWLGITVHFHCLESGMMVTVLDIESSSPVATDDYYHSFNKYKKCVCVVCMCV